MVFHTRVLDSSINMLLVSLKRGLVEMTKLTVYIYNNIHNVRLLHFGPTFFASINVEHTLLCQNFKVDLQGKANKNQLKTNKNM